MTAQDVYELALAHLDEIADTGTVNADTGYEGKAPLIIDTVQREVARYASVNVLERVTALTDTLYVSDDHALRVMPWAVAAEFALQDKMDDEYQHCYIKYKEELKTVRPEREFRKDPYSLLAGMQ